MNRLIMLVIAIAFGCIATAQTPPPPPPKPAAPDVAPPPPDVKKDNIIIRKRGDSKEKLTIVIDGDKVTVNGKPANEFKSDDVEIMSGDDFDDIAPVPPMPYVFSHGGSKTYSRNFNNNFNFDYASNKAFLGVMVDDASSNSGAKITSITKQSAAEKAGLKQGDVITKIGDKSVNDAGDVTEAIGKYKPLEKVTITYLRDGKQATATATLEKNKRTNTFWSSGDGSGFAIAGGDGSPFIEWVGKPHLGIQVQDTDDNNGVKVTNINDDDAPAAKAGIQEDDIITTVNSKNITSVDDLRTAVKDAKEGDTLKLQYKRNNQLQSTDVKFPKRLKKSDL